MKFGLAEEASKQLVLTDDEKQVVEKLRKVWSGILKQPISGLRKYTARIKIVRWNLMKK